MDRELHFGHLPEGILTESHIFIPGLDAPVPYDADEWRQWAALTLAQRERVHAACARDASERRLQVALCKQPHGLGAAYFTIMFGWVYEPRDDDDYAMMPFLLYPKQVEAFLAIDGMMQRPKGQFSSMALPKARGVGATWIVAYDDIHRWIFKKTYQGRLVSRTEDMVDKPGSSDSWMWKYDYAMDRLPAFIVPEGYSSKSKRWRTHMSMVNPVTGSAILGEATTSGVGVGGRATRYSIDEAARFRDLRQVWAQLAETTNHRIAISTHNIEISEDFWNLCEGIKGWPRPVVFPLPWQTILLRDDEWLEETRKTLPEDMFQREVLMNPFAGISTWVYPKAKQKTPVPAFFRRELGLAMHGLDDGYDDDFAIVIGQRDRGNGKFIVHEGYSASHHPITYYGHLLKGEAVARFDWDYEALRIMAWIREHQTWRGTYVGDRHGDNTDLSSGFSPWQMLEREHHIHVQTNPPTMNGLLERRDALLDLLDNIDFADTPGAMAVLEAVQSNRFPTRASHAQPQQEFRRPIHDDSSHFTTALEYIAVHLRFTGAGLSAARTSKPVYNGWMQPKADAFGRRNFRDQQTREERSAWIR